MPKVARNKIRISIGNIDLFAYSILKNIEFLSYLGVVQNELNRYPRLPVLIWLQCQKKGPPNVPGKKVVFQSEITTYSHILFLKKIEILSDQGVVQSEPNLYPRLPVLFRL